MTETPPAGVVLLVEDHPTILRITRRMLERLGYSVIEAERGEVALTALGGEDPIDLVILDLGLPDISGEAVLVEMRRLRPDVRVIVSSGASPGATGEGIAGLQPDGYLDKPYTLDHLRETLDRLG